MDGNGRLVKASAVSLATRSPGSRGVHSGSQLASSGKGQRQALSTQCGKGTQWSIFFPLASGVKL